MEQIGRQDEIEDLSLSPPTMGSMQIAGSNGFGHSIEFMSQAYLTNRSSEIDIEDGIPNASKDRPLPIFLKASLAYSESTTYKTFKLVFINIPIFCNFPFTKE